jgi:hypothetical protein
MSQRRSLGVPIRFERILQISFDFSFEPTGSEVAAVKLS